MEKKFMLTLHISENELPACAAYFFSRKLIYEVQNDSINALRCSTMQYQIESNMSKEEKEGERYKRQLERSIFFTYTSPSYPNDMTRIAEVGILHDQFKDKYYLYAEQSVGIPAVMGEISKEVADRFSMALGLQIIKKGNDLF